MGRKYYREKEEQLGDGGVEFVVSLFWRVIPDHPLYIVYFYTNRRKSFGCIVQSCRHAFSLSCPITSRLSRL